MREKSIQLRIPRIVASPTSIADLSAAHLSFEIAAAIRSGRRRPLGSPTGSLGEIVADAILDRPEMQGPVTRGRKA